MSGGWRGWVMTSAASAGGTAAAGLLSLSFLTFENHVSPLWLPSGVVVAAAAVWGRRALPGVFVGALVVAWQIMAPEQTPIYAAGYVLEAVVGGFLLRRLAGGTPAMRSVPEIVALTIVALLAPVLGATLGVVGVWTAQTLPRDALAAIWLTWWVGDGLGLIVAGSALLAWRGQSLARPSSVRTIEVGVLLGCLALIAYLVFASGLHDRGEDAALAYMPFPLLIWAAMRFDPRVSSFAVLLTCAIAVSGTSQGLGPFGLEHASYSWLLESYLTIMTLSTLTLAANASERHVAQKMLTGRERRFRAITERSAELLAIVGADRVIRYVSPSVEGVLGVPSTDLVDSDMLDWVHAEDRDELASVLSESLEQPGDVFRVEPMRVPVRGGGWVHLEGSVTNLLDDPDVGGLVTNLRDVTGRVAQQRVLERREARFRKLIEHGFDGILVFGEDGCVRDASPSIEQLLGWTPEEVVGKHGSTLVFEEDWELLGAHWRAALAAPGRSLSQEQRMKHRTGRERWVEARLTNLLAESTVNGVVINFNDISDRQRAEHERRELELQMQHAQKLESLGVLAGGIAHDFNNLLAGIMGNADLALRATPDGPARGHLHSAIEASQRAAELCGQLLAYSGRGQFVVEPIDVDGLVREMASLLELSAQRAELVLELEGALPPVEADATQLRQVLMNLVTNAAEAIGEAAGQIVVRTGIDTYDLAGLRGFVLGEELASGEYVVLEVEDTGCGMDPTTRERLFEPFFTTKFAGRGLGMAAVLGIMRGHRGAIRVRSQRDQGTHFTLLLPVAEALQIAPTPGPIPRVERTSEPSPPGSRGVVLLADDEEMIREMGREILELAGYEVALAEDGDQALERFHALAPRIVCVVLDLTMPRRGGDQVLAELRRVDPEVGVLIASGYTDAEIDPRFARDPRLDFIAKPYTITEMQQRVAALARS